MKINDIWNKYKIIIISLKILILLLTIMFIITRNNGNLKDKLLYDKIDNVKLEDVQMLYINVIEVSCTWALYLRIDEAKETKTNDLDTAVLLNYLFKYLERNDSLNEKIDKSVITRATKELFYDVDKVLLRCDCIFF